MHCPLGNHLLRGTGVFITNPRLIRFVNKFFPDYLPSEKVCAKCKQDIGIAYEYKMKRVLASRAQNASLISSYSTDESSAAGHRNNERKSNTIKAQKRHPIASSTTSTDDDQPTTSAQATAKRQRRAENVNRTHQKNPLAINIQKGVRLPHIQPAARRRQVVHMHPDIMDIYIKGMLGG